MKRKRIIIAILIIIWAVAVFYLSNQEADTSSGFSFKFTSIFIKNEELAENIEPYFRKVAHYVEYIIGGVLFGLLFLTYEWNDKKVILSSILLGIWYAALDEIHQIMVPGRAGRIVDVYIDTLGIATGVVLILIMTKINKNKKRKM